MKKHKENIKEEVEEIIEEGEKKTKKIFRKIRKKQILISFFFLLVFSFLIFPTREYGYIIEVPYEVHTYQR